jgi:purine-nucleoside phosphorylase
MSDDTSPIIVTKNLSMFERAGIASRVIKNKISGREPTIGLVLGSGLGGYADTLKDAVKLDYAEIPHFPQLKVVGHAGKLVVGRGPGGVTVAAMQGRVHFYEGHSLERVTFPIRVLIALGVKTFVITNAAGGVNTSYHAGQLVVIADHLNLFPDNPLRGENDDRLGPRFPDMTTAYDPKLRAIAVTVGQGLGLDVREGVYAGSPGPSYETPAEVRMLRTLGADLAGMSTVPEVIVANHGGARVLGISCVTTLAAGITGEKLSHEEVTETATRVRGQLTSLLDGVLAAMAGDK